MSAFPALPSTDTFLNTPLIATSVLQAATMRLDEKKRLELSVNSVTKSVDASLAFNSVAANLPARFGRIPVFYLDIPKAVNENSIQENDDPIGGALIGLSASQRLVYLAKHRPSYIVYLVVPISYALYLIARYGTYLASMFVSTAHADPAVGNKQPAVYGLPYFVPALLCFIGIILLTCASAILFSNKSGNTSKGWDVLKVLSGSILGLLVKSI